MTALLDQVRSIALEPVVVRPGAMDEEIAENLVCISASLATAEQSAVADVAAALCEVLEARRRAVCGYTHAISFYVWHDEMAGQLRLCTASCAPDNLPFEARVAHVGLEQVVSSFLRSPFLEGIPWSELTAAKAGETLDPAEGNLDQPYVVAVFAELISGPPQRSASAAAKS